MEHAWQAIVSFFLNWESASDAKLTTLWLSLERVKIHQIVSTMMKMEHVFVGNIINITKFRDNVLLKIAW